MMPKTTFANGVSPFRFLVEPAVDCRHRILAYLKTHPWTGSTALAEKLDGNVMTIRSLLNKMVKRKQLTYRNATLANSVRQNKLKEYKLPEEGETK